MRAERIPYRICCMDLATMGYVQLGGDNAGHRNVQAHVSTAVHDALQAEADRAADGTTISDIVGAILRKHTGKA